MQKNLITSAGILVMAVFSFTPLSFALDMPEKGLSKTAVEATFGAPMEKTAAVGQPPISHWQYQGFTVYFENQYVIHSVDTAAKANAKVSK